MKVIKTPIEGLLVLEPTIFHDNRGYFCETYNVDTFERMGINVKFVQDNKSFSHKNVLRGLHYQTGAFAQDKLVSVSQGAVMDYAVDIRPDSPTYGQYHCEMLTAENNKMFFIPKGFAHGFVAHMDDTIFNYKCSNVYNKESEGGIVWNDPTIAIRWFVENPIISEKDLKLPKFGEHV
jgi:dTDP-4-dehydrorhamnose 3,5-epimerase